MQVAQKLYEGIPLEDASTPVALITYMRTDSLRIADSALLKHVSILKKSMAKNIFPHQQTSTAKSKRKQHRMLTKQYAQLM